jgi:hypothetical protein
MYVGEDEGAVILRLAERADPPPIETGRGAEKRTKS